MLAIVLSSSSLLTMLPPLPGLLGSSEKVMVIVKTSLITSFGELFVQLWKRDIKPIIAQLSSDFPALLDTVNKVCKHVTWRN